MNLAKAGGRMQMGRQAGPLASARGASAARQNLPR